MRNIGFAFGLVTGYLLFTEDGKELSKKFMGSINKATEEILSTGKKIAKETMPETTKAIEGGMTNE